MKKQIIIHGNAKYVCKNLPKQSIDIVLTSPPYWGLRNYGGERNQIGSELVYSDYIKTMVSLFRDLKPALKDDGVVWLNLGDIWWSKSLCRSKPIEAMYGNRKLGHSIDRSNIAIENQRGGLSKDQGLIKAKDIVGMPWRIALALQDDGWFLRQDVIWSKSNPQPERKLDRFTKAHEYIFMLTKSQKYYFNPNLATEDAVDGSTRQQRSVIAVTSERFKNEHYATMPLKLAEKLLAPVVRKNCIVFDMFSGMGTTGIASKFLGASYIGVELHKPYASESAKRLGIHASVVNLARKGKRKKQLKALIKTI